MPTFVDRLSRAERPRLRRLLDPRLLIVAVTIAAAALRWPTLAGESFWVDEWVTRRIVTRPLTDLLQSVKATESTPPLYYVLLWGWAHVFGASEFALRALSGLFGAATVPVAYAAGRLFASRRAALLTAIFVAASPLLVWYSTEARAYSLFVLLGALTFFFFAKYLLAATPWTLRFWALTSSLALATHYFSVFLIAAEAAVLLCSPASRRREVLRALVPIGTTALVFLPLAYAQRNHGDWIVQLGFARRAGEVGRNFAIGISEPSPWLAWLSAALVAAALVLARRGLQKERFGVKVSLAVAAGGLALALMTAPVRDYILTRNLLALWLPLALAAGIGCGARAAGRAGIAVAAALCTVWLGTVATIATDARLQRGDWKQAAKLLGPASRDRLVLAWDEWGASPLDDALHGAKRLTGVEAVRVAEIDVVGFHGARSRISCWSGAACNVTDVHPPAAPPLSGFALAGRSSASLFEVLRFRARRPIRVRTTDVVDLVAGAVPAAWLQRAASSPSQDSGGTSAASWPSLNG